MIYDGATLQAAASVTLYDYGVPQPGSSETSQMTQNIHDEVVTFKNNLELQLEDIALERDGIVPELYFDTFDLHQIVLGLEAFYHLKVDFDEPKFKNKNTLVHSLAYSGWLGKFKLLPPHQAEFLKLVNFNFGMGIESDPDGRATAFFKDVGLTNPSIFNITSPEDVGKEQLLDFLKVPAGLTEDLFKALQCLLPWHARLGKLIPRNILELEKQKLDFNRLFQSDLIQGLKRSFDARRRNAVVNNFADASAIFMLIDHLEKFNAGTARTIPRFYLSSPLFQEIVDEAGAQRLLTYRNPLGNVSSVLRGSDYYIFKASFRRRQEFAGEADSPTLLASEEYLKELYKEVTSIVESQKVLSIKTLEEIKFDGEPLSKIIKALQTFSFLENVWLKYEAPRESLEVVREVIEAAREMQNTDFEHNVAEAIRATSQKLSENVEEYKWISSLWVNLEIASAALHRRAAVNNFSPPALFRDFGLLRYGFPEDTHRSIREVLEELLYGETTERDARIRVAMACLNGSRDLVNNLNDLVLGVAILIVTKMNAELLSLLEKINPQPHYSLQIALIERMLESNPASQKAAELLRQLEEKHQNSPPDSQTRADLAVGLAYLYFRLWHRRGGYVTWRPNVTATSKEAAAEAQPFVDSAITYAWEAYGLLTDVMKKAYALNLCLYYSVEGGSDDRIPDMNDIAVDLAGYKADRALWQYRFDDTLARYFHRLATVATSEVEWKHLMEKAQMHIEEAYRDTHGDKEVETNNTVISVARQKGFQRSK